MSIGTSHIVSVFTAKSKALDGSQRLVKITRKNTVKTVAEFGERDSLCVSVPRFTLTDSEVLSIKSHVTRMCEEAQKELIVRLVDSGADSIADSQVTFDAIVGQLNEDAAGGRLNRDAVVYWFDNEVLELFKAYVEPKLGIIAGGAPVTEAQAKKLEQRCNVYRDIFAQCASKNALLSVEQVAGLEKVLNELDLNDSVAARIASKLEVMTDKHNEFKAMMMDD